MKQTFVTLVLALAFAAGAAAQSTDTTAVPDSGRAPSPIINYTSAVSSSSPILDNSYPCIVRNINLTYSLAAVKYNATTIAFWLIDHNSFTTSFLAPPTPPSIYNKSVNYNFSGCGITDITINDMYLCNNYAFFCGSMDGNRAFYGFLDISDFYTTPPNVTVQINEVVASSNDPPVTLTKLVAYKLGTMYKVAAIGHKRGDPYYCNDMIVEIFDAETTTPSCKVAEMPVNTPPPPYYYSGKVFLSDITLVNDLVVFLGRDWNVLNPSGISYPWFSVGKRADIIDYICDPAYNYNYYLDNEWDANDTVRGVALDGDKFAMSYVYFDKKNKVFYSRLRVIDFSTLINSYSQQFLLPEKYNPIELIYMSTAQKIVLLQPIKTLSDFIQLCPYATSGYATIMFSPDGRDYKSLSRIGNTSFISARSGKIYLENTSALLPQTPTCPQELRKDVKTITELPIIQAIPGAEVLNSMYSWTQIPFTNEPRAFSNNCYSYE